jgi:hypothetical protein
VQKVGFFYNGFILSGITFSFTGPDDYSQSVLSLTFGPGRTSQVVSVSVINDDLLEALETFFVNLRLPGGGQVDRVEFTPSRASVFILDDHG